MTDKILFAVFAALLATASAAASAVSDRHPLPEGYVYLNEAIPDLVIDLRYAAENNFVGQRVDGYRHAHAILSAPAVAALAKVQAALQPFGLGLKVFDAYPAPAGGRSLRALGPGSGRPTDQTGLLPRCC